MFWLGYDHQPVRKNEIGNHHRIDTKSFDVAKAEYIDSMTKIMNELSRVSKPNSFFTGRRRRFYQRKRRYGIQT